MDVLSLKLPVGFRFSPTDEELIDHFLRLKIEGKGSLVELIPEIDICKHEPEELPCLSMIKNGDPEWFFFTPRDQKYPKGRRSNRATQGGYWKATGMDRRIKSRSCGKKVIGMKKTLVFHRGRAPKGQKTNWIIHEYRMNSAQGQFVLCRLFDKEEKPENSNSEETQPPGSSPTATRSSPEGSPSNLAIVQATSESVLPSPDDTDEHDSSFEAFLEDVIIDTDTEVGQEQVNPPLGVDLSFSQVPTLETLDLKTLPQSLSSGFYYSGNSAIPFGNGLNRMPSPDDTDEHDSSFEAFLDDVIIDTDTEVEQEQTQTPEVIVQFSDGIVGTNVSLQMQTVKHGDGNMNYVLNDYAAPDASSPDSAPLPFRDLFNGREETICQKNPVYDRDVPSGTGIKIRSRESQSRSSSQNFVNQGNAVRRLRFQRKLTRRAVSFEGRESGCNAEDNEAVGEAIEHTANDEVQETSLIDSLINEEISHEPDTKLRLRLSSRQGGVINKDRQPTSLLAEVPSTHRSSFSSQYRILVALVMFVFILFVGAWRYLKS